MDAPTMFKRLLVVGEVFIGMALLAALPGPHAKYLAYGGWTFHIIGALIPLWMVFIIYRSGSNNEDEKFRWSTFFKDSRKGIIFVVVVTTLVVALLATRN